MAATATFLRYGFKKTSMDDVAQAAGVSRQGLYLYFDTKDFLFREALQYLVSHMISTAHSVAEDGTPVSGIACWEFLRPCTAARFRARRQSMPSNCCSQRSLPTNQVEKAAPLPPQQAAPAPPAAPTPPKEADSTAVKAAEPTTGHSDFMSAAITK